MPFIICCRDTFIIEYVGEVLDPQKFRKRARKYSKDDVQHFYFMALSSDYFLDASEKGNVSRFINHSCDPNAETQKVWDWWGFFFFEIISSKR